MIPCYLIRPTLSRARGAVPGQFFSTGFYQYARSSTHWNLDVPAAICKSTPPHQPFEPVPAGSHPLSHEFDQTANQILPTNLLNPPQPTTLFPVYPAQSQEETLPAVSVFKYSL
jgi:hypothetical protein